LARKTTQTTKKLNKGLFSSIRVQFQQPVVEVWSRLGHAAERVADRFGQLGLAGYFRQLQLQLVLQFIEDRLGFRLTQGDAFIWAFVARLLLDGIEPGDPFDDAPGDDRPIALEDIHELAADMDHAGLLRGEPIAEQAIEAGEAVRCPAGDCGAICREGACTVPL